MTKAKNAIVVDKNVWLDFYLVDRPLHAEAMQFITAAEKHDANLALPADAVKDIFFIIGRHMKQLFIQNGGIIDERMGCTIRDFAWQCVDHMTDIAVSIPMDDRTAWLTRHYRDVSLDYEDGSVLASCELCKARYLVTHDKSLSARANIATKTAAEMACLITKAYE